MFETEKLKDDAFIIAEVGQNHQGDFDLAIKYIDKFSELGADAIKFQTRDIDFLFSEDALLKEYNSPTAFANTYGDHRRYLEFNKDQVEKLKWHCENRGVLFMSTPFDEPSLYFLDKIGTKVFKVASFDIGNLPFLCKLRDINKPLVVSVGGGKQEHIKSSMDILKNTDLALLHCVSEYPCEYNRLGLSNISELKKKYPHVQIGISDHFNGTLSGPIAYMAGARVFEKHVTFNHAWKGTDHPFALETKGFETFVRDIRRIPEMFNKKPYDEIGSEPVFQKLGKSIIAATDIEAGTTLTENNLTGRILTSVIIPVRESCNLLGVKAKRAYQKFEPIDMNEIR
jgi:N-acetylneuraminate synthase/sialic acid synthase